MDKILEVKHLQTSFATSGGLVTAVEDVNFHVNRGEILGIIGESGSGKSVTSLSVMRLLNKGAARIPPRSEIWFNGRNLLQLSEKEMRKIRGKEISMIFQDPLTSLNPVYTIGRQMKEVFLLHRKADRRGWEDEAVRMLELVGISSPRERLKQYPHELSGGMRQRIMIAMALACQPKLLIADEPTTALDVTIQAQILDLLKELRRQFQLSVMIITHDLGVIADMADRVIVMYAGQIVESGPVEHIFAQPLHPYTEGLLQSIPRLETSGRRLHSIGGSIPGPHEKIEGCKFHPRCPYATEQCRSAVPAHLQYDGDRTVSCWLRQPAEQSTLLGG